MTSQEPQAGPGNAFAALMPRVIAAAARLRHCVRRRNRPDRHLAFHRLMEACGTGMCPICRLVADGVERRLAHLFHELVNDPDARRSLRAALGFCRRHATDALRVGTPLGLAIIYEDVATHALSRLRAVVAGRHADRRRICPACIGESEDEVAYTEGLAECLGEPDMRLVYTRGSGLCIRHLDGVVRRTAPAVRRFLVDQEAGRLSDLIADLKELMRKSDYRYAGETVGQERDAPARAIAKVIGDEVGGMGGRRGGGRSVLL